MKKMFTFWTLESELLLILFCEKAFIVQFCYIETKLLVVILGKIYSATNFRSFIGLSLIPQKLLRRASQSLPKRIQKLQKKTGNTTVQKIWNSNGERLFYEPPKKIFSESEVFVSNLLVNLKEKNIVFELSINKFNNSIDLKRKVKLLIIQFFSH